MPKYCRIHQYLYTGPQCIFCMADRAHEEYLEAAAQKDLDILRQIRLDEEDYEMEELDMM